MTVLSLFIFTQNLWAQGGMAEKLRSDGKIWVVVGVITIILLGLFAYLFWLDKRITRLEKSKWKN